MKNKLYHAVWLMSLTHNEDVTNTNDELVYMSEFEITKDWTFKLIKWFQEFERSNKASYRISNVEVEFMFDKKYRIILK